MATQDLDAFSDCEKFSILSLAHQWLLCGEWMSSESESKQMIKPPQ